MAAFIVTMQCIVRKCSYFEFGTIIVIEIVLFRAKYYDFLQAVLLMAIISEY